MAMKLFKSSQIVHMPCVYLSNIAPCIDGRHRVRRRDSCMETGLILLIEQCHKSPFTQIVSTVLILLLRN